MEEYSKPPCFVCTPEDKSVTSVCNEHSMSITINQLKCPKCGWECITGGGFSVNFVEDFDGDYCTKCWAKDDIVKKIPKMI